MARAKKTKAHISGCWGGPECGTIGVPEFTTRDFVNLTEDEIRDRLAGRRLCKSCVRILRGAIFWRVDHEGDEETLAVLERLTGDAQ